MTVIVEGLGINQSVTRFLMGYMPVLLSSVLLAQLMATASVWALAPGQEINWDGLSLNNDQRDHLTELDSRWKSVYYELAPRIKSNEARLMQMMNTPQPNSQEVIRLQKQIHDDKTRLKMEATQIFLAKRKYLTPDQDERLIRMINNTSPASAAPR